MSGDDPQRDRTRRVAGVAAALLFAAAIAASPARSPLAGLAPGDVTLAVRFALISCATFAAMVAMAGPGFRAIGLGLSVIAPAALFLPFFPAIAAPIGLVPFYFAIARTRSPRAAAWLGALAGACQVLGAAGWIFQYFTRPWVPALIATTILVAQWVMLAGATRALVSRSLLWIPVAAALVPLSEAIRCEWMSPPLPGISIAEANASTGLAALAPALGEAGVSWAAAALGIAGAAFLSRESVSRFSRGAVLAAVPVALALATPADEAPPSGRALTRICAVRDPTRSSSGRAFGDGGDAVIFALVERAKALGCEIVVFPEYSVELTPNQVLPASWALERLEHELTVLAGASVHYRQHEIPRHWLRNVVCRLQLGPGRQINCAGGFDKLVFAPFGEAQLFQDSSALARLGAWLSLVATNTQFAPLRSIQPVGVLPIGGGKRASIAICWEVLIPRIFQRRGVAGPGDVDLLAVVSDLDGFGDSLAAIDLFRRAATLHAISLDAPLLFASTNDPFLVLRSGRLAKPVHEEDFVVAWEIAL